MTYLAFATTKSEKQKECVVVRYCLLSVLLSFVGCWKPSHLDLNESRHSRGVAQWSPDDWETTESVERLEREGVSYGMTCTAWLYLPRLIASAARKDCYTELRTSAECEQLAQKVEYEANQKHSLGVRIETNDIKLSRPRNWEFVLVTPTGTYRPEPENNIPEGFVHTDFKGQTTITWVAHTSLVVSDRPVYEGTWQLRCIPPLSTPPIDLYWHWPDGQSGFALEKEDAQED